MKPGNSSLGASFIQCDLQTNFNNSCSQNKSLDQQSENGAGYTGVVVWCATFALTSFFIIATNAITIKIFCTNPELKKKKEHIFLLSLAVADGIVGTISVPLNIILLMMAWSRNFFAQSYKTLTGLFLFFDVFSGLASVFTLTAIAIERLFSVARPQKHRAINRKKYQYLVRVPWGLALLLGILYVLSLSKGYPPFDDFFQFIVILVTLSFILIIICYIGIWVSIKNEKSTKRLSQVSLRNGKSYFQIRKERKMTYVVVIVTSAFVITWLPFQIINVIYYACKCQPGYSQSLINIIKLLQYFNSLLDPIIYSLVIDKFRKCLRKTVWNMRRQ